jgi:hypothetical protein
MGTKQTKFQPDHSGKHAPVPVHPGMTVSHNSHGVGADTPARHGERPNIARDATRGKHVRVTPVHGGMTRQVQGQPITGGGHLASALDATSGQVVVPGIPNSTPGYGNSGVQSGHPFAKAPGGKNLAPVKPSFGMKSQSASNADHAALGAAILDAAFSAGSPDDRAAHGRKPDGSK